MIKVCSKQDTDDHHFLKIFQMAVELAITWETTDSSAVPQWEESNNSQLGRFLQERILERQANETNDNINCVRKKLQWGLRWEFDDNSLGF
jgi:hypothetical protein